MGAETRHVAVAMLAVFGTAKLLAELFERFRQPAIVGEILAGVLVGPGVLGWVTPDQTLTTLADLGVMFLLFRVGLEVHPAQLISVGRTALAVAFLGVISPFILGWLVMYAWGESRIESVFVGAALVATSVGITAQILASRGLLAHRASRVILAAAVIDDVLGFMVLACVTAVAREHLVVIDLLLSGLAAAGFTMIIARWGAGAVARAFPRVERSLRAGEVQFNLAMVTLFGLALIATFAGVAAIIGAFLAGMALSDSLEPRVHVLSTGVAELFTPFFLVMIGLHLDPRMLFSARTIGLVLAIAAAAVISKLIGCGLGALRMGYTDAFRVGTGMVPRGEVGMVVAQIGLRMNVISGEVYAAVVMVAVITTLLAPVLVALAFRGIGRQRSEAAEELTIG